MICPGCATTLSIRTQVSKIVKIPITSCFGSTVAATTPILYCPVCTCELSIVVSISPVPTMGTVKRAPDFMDKPIEEIVKHDLTEVFPKEPRILYPSPTASWPPKLPGGE